MSRCIAGLPWASIQEVDSIPDSLPDARKVGAFSWAQPNLFLRIVPGVGRFLVRDGAVVEVTPAAGVTEREFEQHLNGVVRAALILQAGGLPLHGASLVPPGSEGCVGLVGDSGAGKSTLAAELVRRGWSLMGDDIIPVFDSDCGPLVRPSAHGVRLWVDACKRLGIQHENLPHVAGEHDKFVVPLVTRESPAGLKQVFFLDRSGMCAISPVTGPQRLAMLTRHTYRRSHINGFQCLDRHVAMAARIASSTGMFRVHGGENPGKTADALQEFLGV